MGGLWEVVGGSDKGGIVVRMEKDITSPQADSRLATGALVKQRELVGDRLHFEKLEGEGPFSGWVSIALKDGKTLMAASTREAPNQIKVEPATSRLSFDTPARERIPDAVKETLAIFDPSKITEVFNNILNNEKGVHFGELFPHTAAQVVEFGCEYLTWAMQEAGSLPKDNAVKRFVDMKEFSGGGAAAKAVLTVEYEKPDENLHTQLFLKMPLEPTEKNRLFCINLAMEGGELLFNRFMIRCLPIRTPKYYFGEINMKTTNWILISEALPFADKSTRGQRLGPYELEAPVLKGMDWILPDKVEKYYALWRVNAIMCAWGHTGKLGDLTEVYAVPDTARNVLFPVPEKRFAPFWEQTKDFVLNVAPSCFPKEVANAAYMDKLEKEVKEVAANIHCFNDHLKNTTKDHWGLVHINSHIDNAFFWVDDQGRVDAGLLDFGGLQTTLLGAALGGNMGVADADVRAFHMEGLARCFCDTLREYGGPSLNAWDLYFNVALIDMKGITAAMQNVVSGGFGGIYEHLPKEQWADVTQGLEDPIFAVETVARMMLRTAVVGLVEGLKTWQKGQYGERFADWRRRFGKETNKKKS